MTFDHAVIVAGHAVLRRLADPRDEANWFLLDFQRGEVPWLLGHAEAGVRAAAADPRAMLIFSGGQTRQEAGPRSEAESYAWAAAHEGWFGFPEVAGRAVTEEFARDSFENLLFSLAQFRLATGVWPRQVSFVSWQFKQQRFELHRAAIGWPAERFTFLGANDPPALEQAVAAEARTRAGCLADPYSARAEFAAKKESRNPFGRVPPYPELDALMRHKGPSPYTGPLPWGPPVV